MKENTLFVEHYRPTKLDNYVGNENIKKVIKQYLDQDDIQNLCFYGPVGTGKTTLAKLIVKNLDCDYLYINASDERGIDTIRDKVTSFASTASFKSLKVVILDEADFLTINAQASLRNVIETFSRSTRFILTCNYIERIIDPLQSRCQTLKIVPPSKVEVAKHLAWILGEENISFIVDDIKNIVNQFYPDLRKMLNTIQLSIIDNKLSVDKSVLVSNNYMNLLLKELKSKKVSLILTSPPYPGINIPYSRWQIHGRRNTTLPYLILGLERPKIKSIYNFQNPTNNTFDVYFNTMRNIFSSLRKISSNKTLILQLVAFNNKDGVFSKYLKTMEECGFKELKIKSNGYIWRKVPNRSWQARLKGNIPASNEVLLLHKLK